MGRAVASTPTALNMQTYADKPIQNTWPLPPESDRGKAAGRVGPWAPAPLALGLAFFAIGLQFCFPRLFAFLRLPLIPFLGMAMCLPATLLGVGSWLRARSFAASWPVVVCALLAWASLVYAEESQGKRAFYFAALLTMTLPVAALIAQQRAWAFCAKAFILGSAAATLIVAWLQLVVERGWMNIGGIRFGLFFHRSLGERATNPNEVGFQLALATILTLVLYLRSGTAGSDSSRRNRGGLGLVLMAILTSGCLLTVCRGAIVSIAVGLSILLLRGTRGQYIGRLRELVVATVLALTFVLFLAAASGRTPWEGLKNRFVGDKSVSTLGNRLDIWKNVFRAIGSNPKYLWFGAGTGMASQVLGRFDVGAMEDDYGQLHRNCHNIYLDWILTYGLLGLAAGACLVLAVWHRAVGLDRRDGGIARISFLATVSLLGMTGTMYQHVAWAATGSLVLAMLSDAPLFGGPLPSARARTRSPFDLPAALPRRRPARTAAVPCVSPAAGARPQTVRCSTAVERLPPQAPARSRT